MSLQSKHRQGGCHKQHEHNSPALTYQAAATPRGELMHMNHAPREDKCREQECPSVVRRAKSDEQGEKQRRGGHIRKKIFSVPPQHHNSEGNGAGGDGRLRARRSHPRVVCAVLPDCQQASVSRPQPARVGAN